MTEKSAHELNATEETRDDHGRFANVDNPTEHHQNPVSHFLSTHTNKSSDDLLDIHVGNPLKKIANLLEEIKKQKAFSFTMKGSLGVMGIVLVLSTFGILGGNKLLCDKGRQSHSGMLRILNTKDQEESKIPFIGNLFNFMAKSHQRVVLESTNLNLISIPYNKEIDTSMYKDTHVIVTGNYDSCSQILTPNNPGDVELYR